MVDLEKGTISDGMSSSTMARQSPSTQLSFLIPCFCYGGISVLLVFTNKGVFQYGFKTPMFLLACQAIFAIVWVGASGIKFPAGIWSPERRRLLLRLGGVYAAKGASDLMALRLVSIPIYSVLKRLTTIATMSTNYALYGKVETKEVMGACLLLCLGAIVTGVTDLTFDATGYLITMGACTMTAANNVFIKETKGELNLMPEEEDKFTSQVQVFFNSCFALPWLLLAMVVTGEHHQILSFPHWHDPHFLVQFLLSTGLGMVLQITMTWCASATSALTVTLVGQFKTIAQTFLGLFITASTPITWPNLLGLSIASTGGLLYTYLKSTQPAKPAQKSSLRST